MSRLALALVVLMGTAGRSVALADDPAEIRALLDRQVDDWNRGDLDGFCDAYWKSPALVFQSAGERNLGWDAMRARYRARYQGEGREMGRLAFRDLEVQTLGPDSAFARGRWGLSLSGGKAAGGLFTLILRKRPEGWRIVHDHTSSDATPPAANPEGPDRVKNGGG